MSCGAIINNDIICDIEIDIQYNEGFEGIVVNMNGVEDGVLVGGLDFGNATFLIGLYEGYFIGLFIGHLTVIFLFFSFLYFASVLVLAISILVLGVSILKLLYDLTQSTSATTRLIRHKTPTYQTQTNSGDRKRSDTSCC